MRKMSDAIDSAPLRPTGPIFPSMKDMRISPRPMLSALA